jgi:hypothetical protein
MGEITGTRIYGDKVVFTVCLDEKEALALEGRIRNIHLFTLYADHVDSDIMSKSVNNSMKYVAIPPKYRSKAKNNPRLASIQVIETDTKAMFIYICEK